MLRLYLCASIYKENKVIIVRIEGVVKTGHLFFVLSSFCLRWSSCTAKRQSAALGFLAFLQPQQILFNLTQTLKVSSEFPSLVLSCA